MAICATKAHFCRMFEVGNSSLADNVTHVGREALFTGAQPGSCGLGNLCGENIAVFPKTVWVEPIFLTRYHNNVYS